MFSHAALNATLNGTSAVLLTCGYLAIRARKIAVHKAFMIAAFVTSTAFLISYLAYHYRVGHVAFQGQGWIRPVYFTLLGTHTILAMTVVPLALVSLARALKGNFCEQDSREHSGLRDGQTSLGSIDPTFTQSMMGGERFAKYVT